MPSPADKTVLAFQELARLAQLTEWLGKEGQPWKARDSHCVDDELSSNLALPAACPLYLAHVRTHTCTSRHTHTRTSGRHRETPSWRKQHKGSIKEFPICFYLLVKEFVHSARETY